MQLKTTTLSLLPLLTSAAPATFFSITDFTASDVRIPSEKHYITFNISNPNAVTEQGGNGIFTCNIEWDGCEVPTCNKLCTLAEGSGYGYHVRVTPGTYGSASNFSLDINHYFIYRNSGLNNATIPISLPSTTFGTPGYRCSRGGQSDICGIWDAPYGLNVTFETNYSVQPVPDVCSE